ncbi:hypothetical protein EIP91_001740 [Steccherinum ochraceum]|uniref:Protein kinase domain-containing protein n=1 Tax=Steccherinum ochraceum TaxID=92696 RepID=A0A4R0RDG7_9APHY|nr:hypothetical protein EIP91_001740 [Steccherinum ochraceum]
MKLFKATKALPESECAINLRSNDRYLYWKGGARLDDGYWRSQYDFLLSKGYRLRSYFHPEPCCRPPSVLPAKDRYLREYTPPAACDLRWRPFAPIQFVYPDAMDATDSQGNLVIIRSMQDDSVELDLLRRFSRPDMRAHRFNHCNPILTEFDNPADPSATFVVTLYLVQTDICSWWRVDDFLEFGTQVLEGLAFFHEQGISNIWGITSAVGLLSTTLCPGESPRFRGNTPCYFAYLDGCDVEATGTAATRGVDCYESEKPQSPKTQSDGPVRPRLTNSMKGDLKYLADFADAVRRANRLTLSSTEPLLMRMLNDDDPPDAEAALREWNRLRAETGWMKKMCSMASWSTLRFQWRFC